jgi:hypothetical protein
MDKATSPTTKPWCLSSPEKAGRSQHLIKKALVLTGKLEALDYLAGEERLQVCVACEAIGLARTIFHKKQAGLNQKDRPVMEALNHVVGKDGCWGFGLCFACLLNQGVTWSHKRVRRVIRR